MQTKDKSGAFGGYGKLPKHRFSFDFGTITASMFAIPLHEVLGLPKFLAQFVSEFVMDLFDKCDSLVIVFFVLKAMPNRFLAKLPLGDIYVKDAE